ncbi:MAG: DNA methyltransferase [Ferruginibacter sp.]
MDIKQEIFANIDFNIIFNEEFKEDSVREVLILPILYKLGYAQSDIIRSKALQHSFLKIGSRKRPITLIPDYVLKVEGTYAWVLDAKEPNESILEGDNVEQVYSYASASEIRSTYFALCNGKQFVLFRRESTGLPILSFFLSEINNYWQELIRYLSPSSFQFGKSFVYEPPELYKSDIKFNYLSRPLLEEIIVQKQSAKRHFGVHGYFTKQAWNVVNEYIRNFSQPNDLILDPFGGSGVTAIEAIMLDRKSISIDLNPLAVFIVSALIAPSKQNDLIEAFNRVKVNYLRNEPHDDNSIDIALKKYPFPKQAKLPKGSDVETVDQLFDKKQLSQLACLKYFIKMEKDQNVQMSLLLMFSGLINKINLTYHASEGRSEGRGNSSVFAYYRYRIAKDPAHIDLWTYFESRFKKVLAAKKEIETKINEKTIENIKIIQGTATKLTFIKKETIDYIYTDPPYGKKIPYLDLSVMWNSWLDLTVSESDYQMEAIEGGEHEKSKEDYNELIAESIREMYRVLKFDRWMSFVFAHKDPEFWHLIIDTAERCGFEYSGAVKQSNGQSSFKKRQNPFTVLSGQLIINFKKIRNPKAIMKANLGMNISEIVMQTIEGIIAKFNGASLEQINDELIIKGLELGFLDLLKQEYSDLTPILLDNFSYNSSTELFTIKNDEKFKTHLDVKLRIKYYITSFLVRKNLENKSAHFDEIVLHILPLLKNGNTPENQTIISVLEDIGEKIDKDSWQLKRTGQGKLF